MHVWRADMRVDPMPRIEGALHRFATVVLVVAVFMVVIVIVGGVSMLREMIALHVNSAVEIRVCLVDECLTDRLASVTERDGKSAIALHNLGHRFAKAGISMSGCLEGIRRCATMCSGRIRLRMWPIIAFIMMHSLIQRWSCIIDPH